MAAQSKVEGRYLGGRTPYGYMLDDAGPHPNPSKAADGKRLHRLVLDPTAAPVVRIFQHYLPGVGIFATHQRTTVSTTPHRSGIAWSRSAIAMAHSRSRGEHEEPFVRNGLQGG